MPLFDRIIQLPGRGFGHIQLIRIICRTGILQPPPGGGKFALSISRIAIQKVIAAQERKS
jgi:hypothetical protein